MNPLQVIRASVVQIRSDQGVIGTGFVVTEGGLVVTCAHVITGAGVEPGSDIALRFLEDRMGPVRTAKVCPHFWSESDDLAVLRLDQDGKLPPKVRPVSFGPSAQLREVCAVGFPSGAEHEETPVVRVANVTGSYFGGDRRIDLDAPAIRPGYSGGPLLDATNHWVAGIIRAVQCTSDLGRPSVMAYAIPTETLATLTARVLVDCPDDRDAIALHDALAAALDPGNALPGHRADTGCPLRADRRDELSAVLGLCEVVGTSAIFVLLSRLPAQFVRRMAPMPMGTSDRAKALIDASGDLFLDWLIAAVVALDESEPARSFDILAAKSTQRSVTEFEIQTYHARASRAVEDGGLNPLDVRKHAKAATFGQGLPVYDQKHRAHRLMWLIRVLSEIPPAGESGPLYAFMAALEGRDDPLPAIEPQPTLYSLMVSVEPAGRDRFTANIWGLAGEDGKLFGRKFHDVEDGVLSLIELRERVDKVRDAFVTEHAIPDDLLWVEFVLPRSLICEAVEHWQIKVGRQHSPLGDQCRVILRSRERLYEPALRGRWGTWQQKWQTHRLRPCFHEIHAYDASCAATVFSRLREAEVSGAALALKLSATSDNPKDDPFSVCIDAGIPVLLWQREHADAAHDWIREAELAPQELPAWLRRVRSASVEQREEHPHWQLALLWDDPTRLPPDVQFRRSNLAKRITQ